MVPSESFTQCVDQLRTQNEEWRYKFEQLQCAYQETCVSRDRTLRDVAKQRHRKKAILAKNSQLEEENISLISELERLRARNTALESQGHLAMKTMRELSEICGAGRR